MKKILFSFALAVVTLTSQAQNMFNHLDLGVTLGTTGIGLDAAMPVGDYVKLRTGFEVMPRFNYDMNFGVESFDGTGTSIDQSTFNRMAEVLYGLTGFKVDQNVTMKGKPTMWNFKFMVDVYPFKNNKHWHFTAGFHWGPSKIAEAVNAQEDSPSLFAVGMYNHIYDVAYQDWVLDIPTPIIETETTGAVYLDPSMEKTILSMGRMGIPIGKYSHDMTDAQGNAHKQGETYYMQPNENSMVSVDARTNSFKPYLGVGYEGRLIKGNDNYKIGFDAGLMFWGGTPSIITHDGMDLANDVEDINGKVGDYVKLIKGVKAFPVLNLRITRRIF
ncbi:MAG: hypothetical protein IJG07_12820 [Prevotella sp.]|nr:hypothetical protein [Prevotella sp.]